MANDGTKQQRHFVLAFMATRYTRTSHKHKYCKNVQV